MMVFNTYLVLLFLALSFIVASCDDVEVEPYLKSGVGRNTKPPKDISFTTTSHFDYLQHWLHCYMNL